MKRKTICLILALALTLCLSLAASAFAAGTPHTVTGERASITITNVEGTATASFINLSNSLFEEREIFLVGESGTEVVFESTVPADISDAEYNMVIWIQNESGGYIVDSGGELNVPELSEGKYGLVLAPDSYTITRNWIASYEFGDAIVYLAFAENPTPALPPAANEIQVLLNNVPIAFDQTPIIENERTLVPVRAIAESFGAEVGWIQATRTVTIAF